MRILLIDRKIVSALILVSVASIIFVLCSYFLVDNHKDAAVDGKHIEVLHLDYPVYGSLKDLTKRSEYVFIGKINDNGSLREVRRPSTGDSRFPNQFDSIIYTDYEVSVNKVLKGKIKNKKITLSSMGGRER